jgi:hypothetical protein
VVSLVEKGAALAKEKISAGHNGAESWKLGDRVSIRHSGGLRGRIVELRGPLGPSGAQIYRVRVRGMAEPTYIELRGDQLALIPAVG